MGDWVFGHADKNDFTSLGPNLPSRKCLLVRALVLVPIEAKAPVTEAPVAKTVLGAVLRAAAAVAVAVAAE